MKDIIFITWFSHRRTSEICNYFDIPLMELISVHRGLRRYIELSKRTWTLLQRERPRILLVQSPSVVLALVTLFWKRWFRYRLVIDAHNEAVEPFSNAFIIMRWITNLLLRYADRTIVTNPQLAKIVFKHGGVPLVLPDRIPIIPEQIPKFIVSEKFNVAVIATFASDEPIDQIISAANELNSGYHFYVTGSLNKIPENLRNSAPENITFCGFLTEHEYWALLKSCDIVMDLTLKDNCLVCGAYEALAVGTPMILSDNPACVDLFKGIAYFTGNTVESIKHCLEKALLSIDMLRYQLMQQRPVLEKKWIDYAEIIHQNLNNLKEVDES